MKHLWQVPIGGLVVCEIYEVFEHSGVVIGPQQILELHGSGLVRIVGPERFLHGRSGDSIEVVVNPRGEVLRWPEFEHELVERGLNLLYQQLPYDVIDLNCHRFCFFILTGQWREITTYNDLKRALSSFFNSTICHEPIRF